MSLEIIFRDHRNRQIRFSPARDIAWYWPWLLANVAPWLEYHRWDENIRKLMDQENLSEMDLMLAFIHLVQFMERALDPEIKSPKEALDAVRFFECHQSAITALMYRVGIACVGAWFDGIRRVTPENTMPDEIRKLLQAAEEFLKEMNDSFPKNTSPEAAPDSANSTSQNAQNQAEEPPAGHETQTASGGTDGSKGDSEDQKGLNSAQN